MLDLCWWYSSIACLLPLLLLTAVVCILLSDGDLTLMWVDRFGKPKDTLAGKVVWITGASSGIGEHLAYELAAAGCKLVLSARRRQELERVQKQCLLSGKLREEDVMILPLDLCDVSSHKKAVEDVLSRFGNVEILVNNGGRSLRALAIDTDLEVDRRILELNTLGTISLTKQVLPHMVKRRQGQIVVNSSLAGKIGSPMSASYSASKFALQGWFSALRTEVFQHNIDICLVCPGPVYSNILQVAFTGKPDKILNETQNYAHKKVTTARCAALMAVAMANRLPEVWISLNPSLMFAYLTQYTPTLTTRLFTRFGLKAAQGVRGDGKQV